MVRVLRSSPTMHHLTARTSGPAPCSSCVIYVPVIGKSSSEGSLDKCIIYQFPVCRRHPRELLFRRLLLESRRVRMSKFDLLLRTQRVIRVTRGRRCGSQLGQSTARLHHSRCDKGRIIGSMLNNECLYLEVQYIAFNSSMSYIEYGNMINRRFLIRQSSTLRSITS